MIRALDTLSFWLCLLGWLVLGIFGTWERAAPFWLGAPLIWASALCGLFTLHWGLRGRLSKSCLISVILFTGYVAWRALTSDVAYLARQDLVFAATAFIGWVLTAARYEKQSQRSALMVIWSLLILANLGMGLYQQAGHKTANPLSFWDFTRPYEDAVFGGFFPNSNHLCGFLELSSFIFLAIALFGKVHSFVRLLCGLVFVAACAAVSLSTSRGGWVAFTFGIVALGALAGLLHLLRSRRNRVKSSTAGLLFGVLVLIVGSMGFTAWHQLKTHFGEGKVFENLNGRTDMWARAMEQWDRSPLTGTGARSYEYYERSFRHLETRWVTWNDVDVDAQFAHNDWIQLLADYGLVGLVLALAVLFTHCWKSFSFLITDANRRSAEKTSLFSDYRGAIMLGALAGILSFALHCIADFQMHIGVNAVLAAAILGLMANPGRPAPSSSPEPTPSVPPAPAWPKMVAVVTAVLPAAALAWCFLPWAESDRRYYRSLGKLDLVDPESGDSDEKILLAAADMQAAIASDPLHYDAYYRWGIADQGFAAMMAGAPNVQRMYFLKSIDRFKGAHRLYPQNPTYSSSIARAYDGLREFQAAEEWHQKALAWGDGSRLVHWWYADHLKATGKYRLALDHYTAVIHRHAVGSWKRTQLQRLIDECTARLRQQEQKDAAPQ